MCADVCDKVGTSPVECVRNVCGSLLKFHIFSDSRSDFSVFVRIFCPQVLAPTFWPPT